jgi:plasmid stability protein
MMTTITIKNIPPVLYERIKQKAKVNRRSINNEIITILEQGLAIRTQAEVSELLESARKIRELTARYTLTDEEIEKAINEGRA